MPDIAADFLYLACHCTCAVCACMPLHVCACRMCALLRVRLCVSGCRHGAHAATQSLMTGSHFCPALTAYSTRCLGIHQKHLARKKYLLTPDHFVCHMCTLFLHMFQDEDMVRALLPGGRRGRRTDVNCPGRHGMSPLMYAAQVREEQNERAAQRPVFNSQYQICILRSATTRRFVCTPRLPMHRGERQSCAVTTGIGKVSSRRTRTTTALDATA